MRTRWFGELPDDETRGSPLRQLAGGVATALDRLQPSAVAAGSGLVLPEVSAVVVPHARLPGCSLVLQVSDWSSSVGCWWSARTDPGDGPPTLELFAEFPLRPDGIAHAVAWFEQELRRPLVEQVRGFGVVCRRDWLVELDDGGQVVLRREWLPAWGRPSWALNAVEQRDAGWLAASEPGEEGDEHTTDEGVAAQPSDRWLLGAASVAATAAWILGFVTVFGSSEPGGLAWVVPTVRGLWTAAFAMLFTWFGVTALDRPARLRVPMLAGLFLSMLRAALDFLAGPAAPPSGTGSALQVLGAFLRDRWPDLLGVAALGGFLVAFLGMPGGGVLRRSWPRVLPVAVLVWLADLAVGLRWLAPVTLVTLGGGDERAVLTLPGVLSVAARAVAVGVAIALLLVVLDRRARMAGWAVRAGIAGAVLLALAWAATVEVGLARLAGRLPPVLASAMLSAPFGPVLFAGTALVATAAAKAPALASRRGGRSRPRAPTTAHET